MMYDVGAPERGSVSGLFTADGPGYCDTCDVGILAGDDIGLIRDEMFCATCYRRSGAGNL